VIASAADPALLLGQVSGVPVNDPAQLLVGEPAAMRLAGALLGALAELRPKSSVQVVAAFFGEPRCRDRSLMAPILSNPGSLTHPPSQRGRPRDRARGLRI